MLGKIIGRSSTNEFVFLMEKSCNKFEYIQVEHREGYPVLAQIVEIEKDRDRTIAKCSVVGHRPGSVLVNIRTPLEPDSDVIKAPDEFVEDTLGLKAEKNGAYMGVLEGRDKIKISLDLNKLITRHVAVLARTGAGKSYALSVLLEEILERNIPIVIFDPHGEYPSLKLPSKKSKKHERFGVEPKGYGKKIVEFSPDVEKNPTARPLKLNKENLTGNELMHMLPAKLSSSQIGLLFAALKDMGKTADFEELMVNLQLEENNLKWALISIIDYLRRLNLFSRDCTSLNDLVKPGRASVINLRGVPPEIQEVVAYKLISDLFSARKNSEIPPFFLVLEEAQNYVPERSFGEVKSSKVIRQVIAEGRKFGLGVAVVTQRPARIEKSVLSQCGTQIILKVTNPGDLKTISTSVEGITSETEKEIRNLHIGKAMVVGVVDSPLFVEIRPKKSKHGGETVDIVSTFASLEINDESEEEGSNANLLNIVKPKHSIEDIENMTEKEIKEIKQRLIPCVSFTCNQDNEKFNLLVNLVNGHLVKDTEKGSGTSFIGGLGELSESESKIYALALKLDGEFAAADVFGKSKMQFAEVYDLVKSLVKKDYFKKEGDKYLLSDKVNMFNNLKDYSVFEQTDFMKIDYDKMFDEKYDWKEILTFFKKFVSITSSKKCYLVDYEVHCVAKK
jgi:uncharacterized protein